jgi:hypothetical protein
MGLIKHFEDFKAKTIPTGRFCQHDGPEDECGCHNLTQYLIDGDRAFVGAWHGRKKIRLPKAAVEEIKRIGDRWGYWYEGDGGDIPHVAKVFGDIEYKGSWDELISGDLSKDLENDHLWVYSLFANPKENGTVERVANAPGETVFDKALNSYKLWAFHQDQKRTKAEFSKRMRKFISLLGKAHIKRSKAIANKQTVREFIYGVAEIMWQDYPVGRSAPARLAVKANLLRDTLMLDRIPKGVIFMGNSHIRGIGEFLSSGIGQRK